MAHKLQGMGQYISVIYRQSKLSSLSWPHIPAYNSVESRCTQLSMSRRPHHFDPYIDYLVHMELVDMDRLDDGQVELHKMKDRKEKLI